MSFIVRLCLVRIVWAFFLFRFQVDLRVAWRSLDAYSSLQLSIDYTPAPPFFKVWEYVQQRINWYCFVVQTSSHQGGQALHQKFRCLRAIAVFRSHRSETTVFRPTYDFYFPLRFASATLYSNVQEKQDSTCLNNNLLTAYLSLFQLVSQVLNQLTQVSAFLTSDLFVTPSHFVPSDPPRQCLGKLVRKNQFAASCYTAFPPITSGPPWSLYQSLWAF